MDLVSGGDKDAYKDEVERLSRWCKINNLIVNFRRKKSALQPLLINGECVERVSDFRFLGSWASRLRRTWRSWSTNTTVTIKEAQQRLYFLRLLRKNHVSQ